MRTDQQVKRKLNELILLKRSADERLAAAKAAEGTGEQEIKSLEAQSERLEELAQLLEWVLNEPTGRYHA